MQWIINIMQSYACWSVRMRQKSRSSSQTRPRVASSFFISCDTVNQIPFPYDHVLLTMAHFGRTVASVVACVGLTCHGDALRQGRKIGGPIKTFSTRLVLHRSSIGVSTSVYRSVVRCRSGHRRAQVRLRRLEVGPQTHRHHRCAGPEQQTRRAH